MGLEMRSGLLEAVVDQVIKVSVVLASDPEQVIPPTR